MAKKNRVEETKINDADPAVPANPFEADAAGEAPTNETATALFGQALPLGEAPANPFEAKPEKSTEEAEAEKQRIKDEKKAEAEKKKAERAAAKEKEKQDKKLAKEANKQPVQNGARRPKPDTLCGKAWAIFDTLSEQRGTCCAISDALEVSNKQGLNEGNVRAEYAAYRKFHGITGRIDPLSSVPKPGKETKESVETNGVKEDVPTVSEIAASLGQPLGEALGEDA